MSGAFGIPMLFTTIFTGYIVKTCSIKMAYGSGSKVCFIDKLVNLFVKTIYYVLLPLLFTIIFSHRGLSLADLSITLVSILYAFLSITLLWLVAKNSKPEFKKAFVLTGTFQNTIYLGFPIVMIFCGNIDYAAMYALVLTILHLTTGGLLGGGESIFRKILSIPVLYGFVFGNILHYIVDEVHLVLLMFKSYISVVVTYGSAFIMGYALPLEYNLLRYYVKPVLVISVYRVTVSPLIHYVLSSLVYLPSEAFYQVFIESFMPPALTNIIIAKIYSWDQKLVSISTLISTFISLAIVFLMYWIRLPRIVS